MSRAGRPVVDGELLGRRLFERLRDARHRITLVELLEVTLPLQFAARDVEPCRPRLTTPFEAP